MMRPGEIDALQVKDLHFPEAPELAEGVGLVISIKQAKTRRVWAQQFVIVEDESLIRWLQWWVQGRRPRDRVMRVARRRWSQLVGEALKLLLLTECGFTLGSLRGGGACHHFKTKQNLGLLQFAGRWRRPETLKHYLQEALGVHALAKAPAKATEVMRSTFELVELLNHPPPRALNQLLM